MVTEIQTLEEFQNIISTSTELIVIDFYALWCGPCMKFNPTYELLATKYPFIKFYKINYTNENLKDVIKICQVEVLPTFCFFQNGQYLKKMIGADQVMIEKTMDLIHNNFMMRDD